MTPLNFQAPYALPNGANYQPQPPIGTRLSPVSADYAPCNNQPQWHGQQLQQPTYVSTTEPLNYRRLLDRNMSCNWKYIVDKIVCNNDQQASIFLQQKLKVATADQKFEIVNRHHRSSVSTHGQPLSATSLFNAASSMAHLSRSLLSRKLFAATPLNLSMDAFGCHVVQKAFDCVPEEYKALMVHELLRRIPETVIHRYACHVWQKLFELRWSGFTSSDHEVRQ